MSHPTQISKRTVPTPSSPTSDSCAARDFKITTWRLGMPKAVFYVQSKGQHAGRPLKSPIPNCWAVYTKLEYLFEIAFSIYQSQHLKTLIRGSSVPFLTLGEYRPILLRAASKHQEFNQDLLRTLALLDTQIDNLKAQVKLMQQYQQLMSIKLNRQLNIIPS